MSNSTGLPLSDTREPICPHCLSGPVMARGRISAGGAGMIRTEYRCPDCAKAFVFLRRVGLTTSPQQFTTSLQQWSRGPDPSPSKEEVPMPNTLPSPDV